MSKYDISWINLRDPKSHAGLAGEYGNELTVPYFVIISPEGKIVDKWYGYEKGVIKNQVS